MGYLDVFHAWVRERERKLREEVRTFLVSLRSYSFSPRNLPKILRYESICVKTKAPENSVEEAPFKLGWGVIVIFMAVASSITATASVVAVLSADLLEKLIKATSCSIAAGNDRKGYTVNALHIIATLAGAAFFGLLIIWRQKRFKRFYTVTLSVVFTFVYAVLTANAIAVQIRRDTERSADTDNLQVHTKIMLGVVYWLNKKHGVNITIEGLV